MIFMRIMQREGQMNEQPGEHDGQHGERICACWKNPQFLTGPSSATIAPMEAQAVAIVITRMTRRPSSCNCARRRMVLGVERAIDSAASSR